jgi:hypothetical protein
VSTSSFTPDELRAAAEVNQELGPDYRDAVLESFLDKVGREIDARVDARLNGPPAPRPYPPQQQYQQQYQPQQQYPLQPAQQHATPPPAPGEGHHRDNRPFILAIVTTALGIPLTAIVASLNQGSAGAEFAMLLVIWAAIAIVNVVFNRHRD